MKKLVVKAKRKCYSFMIIYFHLSLFKAQIEILTRMCLFLNKGSWTHAITSLSSLCAGTGTNERCESKHIKSDLKCHLFASEKIPPFLSPSRVINCNFKSISCLTMDFFVHPVFFFSFCLITDLLHLLIFTPDTNKIFLAVWSRISSLTVRSEFFSMLQKTFIFWLFVLDFQLHY